ncbi:SDR family oxidoreductase [Pseudonocardia spinosispora]|uniref:SDR family oxidoreductase n=1 Tax=Pseudonocardia spinosispora TaxID=103441 RepID=UPI000429DBBD|nr:SDR family oxidoreductase [Pseudonocardia spinosispora]
MSTPRFDLTGRTALVTGAGSGIGQRLAVGLAEAGADVGCLDLERQRPGLAETIDRIGTAGRRAITLIADVTDADQVDAAIEAHESQLGPLRIAVNCAGINHSARAEEMTDADWQRMMSVNLTGVFYCCRAESRRMLHHGAGSIINIASMSATIANRGLWQVHYNTSKAGVKHLTTSLALEWALRGIRVNSISPGYIATPMISGPEWKTKTDRFADETPMGRLGTPDDLVGPTVFLASDAAAYCTGTDLLVDGGFTGW